MRFRLLRVVQFAGRAARRGGETFGVDEECDLVVDADLTHEEGAGLRDYESKQRKRDPEARIVAVRLGGKTRFLRVGHDLEAIPDEGKAPTSRPRSARSAARKPPDRR